MSEIKKAKKPRILTASEKMNERRALLIDNIKKIYAGSKGATEGERIDEAKNRITKALLECTSITHRARNRHASRVEHEDGVFYLLDKPLYDGLVSSLSVPAKEISDYSFEIVGNAKYTPIFMAAFELLNNTKETLAPVYASSSYAPEIANHIILEAQKIVDRDRLKQAAANVRDVPSELPTTAHLDGGGATHLITPIQSSVMLRRWANAIDAIRIYMNDNDLRPAANGPIVETSLCYGTFSNIQNVTAIPNGNSSKVVFVHASGKHQQLSDHAKLLLAVKYKGLQSTIGRIIPNFHKEVSILSKATSPWARKALTEKMALRIIEGLTSFLLKFKEKEYDEVKNIGHAYRENGKRISQEEAHLLALLSGNAIANKVNIEKACERVTSCVAKIAIQSGEFSLADAVALKKSLLNNLQEQP